MQTEKYAVYHALRLILKWFKYTLFPKKYFILCLNNDQF